jgi:hypothetical protein
MTDKELKALLFAEKYGIIDYEVKENFMTWVEELPTEGTFLHTLNLDTMKEESEQIKKGYWEE